MERRFLFYLAEFVTRYLGKKSNTLKYLTFKKLLQMERDDQIWSCIFDVLKITAYFTYGCKISTSLEV